jgi:hypothetical protein
MLMRDDWDDAYIQKVKSIDFSCNMVLSMKKIFFGTGLNVYVEDRIIRHLLTCAKCRELYKAYAKEVGFNNFHLITYAINFCERNKSLNLETSDYLTEVKNNKVTRILSRQWTRAASNFDINKLMNMKAFRDLSSEYNSPTGLDYTDFMKFVAIKIAKKIDHLEECLYVTSEEEVFNNAQSK